MSADIAKPAVPKGVLPIMFVPKKDASLYFRVDCRPPNDATAHGSYPNPRLDQCTDSIGKDKLFSTLDSNSEYWQTDVASRDDKSMLFVAHNVLFI